MKMGNRCLILAPIRFVLWKVEFGTRMDYNVGFYIGKICRKNAENV